MRPTVLAVALLLQACAAPAPDAGVGLHRLGIVGGSADTTHDAVVALLGDEGDCSGTIIHVAGGEGVVLTAAHCLGVAPDAVVLGDDHASPSATTFTVLDTIMHPSWNGSDPDFDVGLVRIGDVPAGTPVIPVATTPDGVTAGDEVLHVGYGLTDGAGTTTTTRRAVLNTLDTVTSGLLSYDQADGGPCSGDSGGPALSVDGQARVVGVIGSGDGTCEGFGIDTRVAPLVASFIAPFIGEDVVSCEVCFEAAPESEPCRDAVSACLNDAACAALTACLNDCDDAPCADTCRGEHADGLSAYAAIFTCVCEEACEAVCLGDDLCPDVAGGDTDAVDTDAVDTDTRDADDSDLGADDPDAAASCGCATTTPSAAWLLVLASGLLAARRRR